VHGSDKKQPTSTSTKSRLLPLVRGVEDQTRAAEHARRMSELYERCQVVTLDSDFHLYRRPGRKVIPVLRPD